MIGYVHSNIGFYIGNTSTTAVKFNMPGEKLTAAELSIRICSAHLRLAERSRKQNERGKYEYYSGSIRHLQA